MTVQDVPEVPVAQLRDPHPVVTIVVPMLNEQGSIQACLDAFTAAHDDMAGLTLVAPDAEALERFLGAVPA